MQAPTSGKEMRQASLKTIEAPSGNVYMVRRVFPYKFVAATGGIPDLGPDVLSKMPESERNEYVLRVMTKRGAEATARMELMLKAGLVQPSIGAGEDDITIDDIPAADIPFLLEQITDLAGAGLAARKNLDPTSASAVS